MSDHFQKPYVTEFPRFTLHCDCGNEFNVNVMRFKNREPVTCLVCGELFPPELGERFSKALEDLFSVKHGLKKQNSPFNISFLYKSTFKQPPAPYAFSEADFPDRDPQHHG